MDTRTHCPTPGLSHIAPLLFAILALGACTELPGAGPDTRDTTDTTDAADTRDSSTVSPDDTASDTRDPADPETIPLPVIAEQRRTPPLVWSRGFVVNADGTQLITPMFGLLPDARGPDDPTGPHSFLARVDTTTLTVTGGPYLAVTDTLDIFPSADPTMFWMFGHYFSRFTTLALTATGTLAIGAELTLPDHPRFRYAFWTTDASALAIPYGTDTLWQGFYLVYPSADPAAFAPDAASYDDFPIDPVAFIRLRMTPGPRFLALADAPKAPQDSGCTFFCVKPDDARARFRLFDVEAGDLEAPATPRIAETGRYDDTFRTSPTGRWLVRELDGVVTATDLTGDPATNPPGDGAFTTHNLPCESPGGIVFARDDRAVCVHQDLGATAADGTSHFFVLSADLREVSSVVLPHGVGNLGMGEPSIFIDDAFAHAVAQSHWIDLGTTPLTVRALTLPDAPANRILTALFPSGPWVWVYLPFNAGTHVARLSWADGSIVATPIEGVNLGQIETLADGVAVGRIRFATDPTSTGKPDTIEIYNADFTLRGVIERRR